jgi:hypothetical protein
MNDEFDLALSHINEARIAEQNAETAQHVGTMKEKLEQIRIKLARGSIVNLHNILGCRNSLNSSVKYTNSKGQTVHIYAKLGGGYRKVICDVYGNKIAARASRIANTKYTKAQFQALAENLFDNLYITKLKINQILLGRSKGIDPTCDTAERLIKMQAKLINKLHNFGYTEKQIDDRLKYINECTHREPASSREMTIETLNSNGAAFFIAKKTGLFANKPNPIPEPLCKTSEYLKAKVFGNAENSFIGNQSAKPALIKEIKLDDYLNPTENDTFESPNIPNFNETKVAKDLEN